MNVCMVTSLPIPPEEGIGFYVYNLARHLRRKGHTVDVITRGNWHGTSINHQEGITIYRPPFVPIYPFHVHIHGIFVNRLVKDLEDEFDIVHVHTPLSPPVRTKLPIITTVHTTRKASSRSVPI